MKVARGWEREGSGEFKFKRDRVSVWQDKFWRQNFAQ